jgi:hypothetical protein
MRNFYIFILLSICSLVADAAETKNEVLGEQFIGEYKAMLFENDTAPIEVDLHVDIDCNEIDFCIIDPIDDSKNLDSSGYRDEVMGGNFPIDKISEYFWDLQSDGTKSLKKQAAFQKARERDDRSRYVQSTYYGFEEDIEDIDNDYILAYQIKFNDDNELTSCRIQKYNAKKQLRCITLRDIKKLPKKPAKLTDWDF